MKLGFTAAGDLSCSQFLVGVAQFQMVSFFRVGVGTPSASWRPVGFLTASVDEGLSVRVAKQQNTSIHWLVDCAQDDSKPTGWEAESQGEKGLKCHGHNLELFAYLRRCLVLRGRRLIPVERGRRTAVAITVKMKREGHPSVPFLSRGDLASVENQEARMFTTADV